MITDEEKALQIELARLRIQHGHDMIYWTVLLSVSFSLVAVLITVYIPLGVTTGNPIYFTLGLGFVGFFAFLSATVTVLIVGVRRRLPKEIRDLKKKYLWNSNE
jgi:hypothetical protein